MKKKSLDTYPLLTTTSAKELLEELTERQEGFANNKKQFPGISTHFTDLDSLIGGLQKSQLLILGSRPAMGKTSLAFNIAENICFRSHLPVGIISLEASAKRVREKILSSQSEVELRKIESGELSGSEFQSVVAALNSMKKQTMIINAAPGLSILKIREMAHEMKLSHNIQLLVIDYLQLITIKAPYESSDNRAHDLAEIVRILKFLSKELDIPILCLSQINRKVEERAGHRPVMSDLRDCGAIEEHADIVMLLSRRDYYDPYDRPGMAELSVAKRRYGPIGNIQLAFRKEIGQFANFVQSSPEPFSSFGAYAN